MKYSREHRPKAGNCFVLMPFGIKKLKDGNEFDWDDHYKEVVVPAIQELEMVPIRADDIFGTQPLMDRVWRGIQEAEIVLADLTGRSPNVLYELGLAHVIGKRVILLTMDPNDVPTDLAQYVQVRYSNEGRDLIKFMRDLKENVRAARREPQSESGLYPLPGGGIEPVPANVVAVNERFVIVESADGRKGILNSEDVSWIRVYRDLTQVFSIGQHVDGAFVVGIKGDIRYSLIATEEDPWPKLHAKFAIGQAFRGEVANRVPGVGAFVAMDFGINGLIPEGTIPSTESLERGSEVEAITIRIDSARRMVELRFARTLRDSAPPQAPQQLGKQYVGRIVKLSPKSDYVLIADSANTTAILHISRMSEEFQQRLVERKVELGSEVWVEVAEIRGNRVQLRDIHPPVTAA